MSSQRPSRIFIPQKIVWLCGAPGSGKSTLVQSIIEHCSLAKSAYVDSNDILLDMQKRNGKSNIGHLLKSNSLETDNNNDDNDDNDDNDNNDNNNNNNNNNSNSNNSNNKNNTLDSMYGDGEGEDNDDNGSGSKGVGVNEIKPMDHYRRLMMNVLNGYKHRYGIVVDGFLTCKEHAYVVEFLGKKLKELFSLIRFVVVMLKVDEQHSVRRQCG
ncbi:hypothetical protein RFI_18846 [Reticulomyxa filosa]|uniref:Nephrocystin 3-like N-terminal domain-containing protein n=1 Tax=Reticulomyxa filosa TaxID=46433 RepID=X6MX94_RETFI|nr:hypothetical protein RFI_18846 [Reticulomyxa filosa]|eukprot:ETO18419.1 hypothetical protein RFI_18846 [Reticulomyxa filosa]